MDEPTEGLAPVIVEALTAVLGRLRDEGALSIILVEQNSRVALDFSDAHRGASTRAASSMTATPRRCAPIRRGSRS